MLARCGSSRSLLLALCRREYACGFVFVRVFLCVYVFVLVCVCVCVCVCVILVEGLGGVNAATLCEQSLVLIGAA